MVGKVIDMDSVGKLDCQAVPENGHFFNVVAALNPNFLLSEEVLNNHICEVLSVRIAVAVEAVNSGELEIYH